MYGVDVDPHAYVDPANYTIESDVFGLGFLLFSMATTCQSEAFDFVDSDALTQDALESFKREAAAGYTSLVAELPKTIPRSFVDIMLSCLAFEPKDRPTTAAVVAEMKKLLLLLV